MKSKCGGVSRILCALRAILFSIFVLISFLTCKLTLQICMISILRTWEPAKNVKEDDPVTFFRYVDKIGLEEQSEEDSKSKLGGKTAWRKILKDGRPPMIEG